MGLVHTSVTFKYVDPSIKEPGPSKEFVNQDILVPTGSHLPRVDEAVELMHWDSNKEMRSGIYVVLFVQTRIALFDGNEKPSAWHTTVTVGPLPRDVDPRYVTPGS